MPAVIPVALAVGSAAAGVYGAKKQSESNDKASAASTAASDKATALAQAQEDERKREYDAQTAEQKRQWDVTEANKAPYRAISSDALFKVRDLLGLPQGTVSAGPSGASSAGPTGAVPATPKSVTDAIAAANQIAYGGTQKHTDPNYWEALWAKDPDYAWKRMLGWQAGGADAATSGPYAGAGGASAAAVMPKPSALASSALAPAGVGTAANYSPIIPFSQLMRGVQ